MTRAVRFCCSVRLGQQAWLRVERDGPWVIHPGRTLAEAARTGVYLDGEHWHDQRDGTSFDCC